MAVPITRDGVFFCSSAVSDTGFYVEVEDGYQKHRHARSEPGRLFMLLTYTPPPPVLTKAGDVAKRQPPPHKDEPWHFYCAQLLHYGLKPLKTKAAAKNHLLAAFGTGRDLAVPEWIIQLKAELQEEYAVADSKAREQLRKDEIQRKREIKEERRERAKRTADLVELLDDDTAGSSKKKQKTTRPAEASGGKKAKVSMTPR